MTQILLDRGWGAAGVAIASAPVKGIARLPLSVLKLAFSVLGKSLSNKTASLTAEQFHHAFANSLTETESLDAFKRYVVPAPNSRSVASCICKFHSRHCSHRSIFATTRAHRSFWLQAARIASCRLTSQSKLRSLSRIESRNRLQGISRANALYASSRNQSRRLRARVGALPLERVEADRLSNQTDGWSVQLSA